ncbi:glycoside hydrolase family 2 TIM barrel-domain containing protein [Hymenobacter sp. YC55]|nr:glycoside hydrolase family 2 TIM barrel-domain containing protein [Hymenobacter sp. YC55]
MLISTLKQNLFGVLLLLLLAFNAKAQQLMQLTDKWEFRKAGDSKWGAATVPGTVHTDLLNTNQIQDPFYRTNEKDQQWIGKTDWEYKTTLSFDANQLKSDKLYLVFEGLDTYADVYVNDVKVLEANNMFRQWKKDVKPQLKAGNNSLRVYFHAPVVKGEELFKSLPFQVPASDNDQAGPGEHKVSVFTRKAGYHYGWDWGPRLVTAGIWRPVYLVPMNVARIQDLFIKQKQLTTEQASLEAHLEVESLTAGTKHLEVTVDGSATPIYSQPVYLDKGMNNLVCSFTLPKPELWWPNGYGAQKLYTFRAVLKDGSKALTEKQVRRGMRTVEVIQETGPKANSFYFLVNGVKMFMKGANYIPQDNFLPRVNKVRYEHVINTAVASNMNMLRVWGGGIYENDLFYDLCDEKGILIWQDFMFACAMVPPLENHMQNIYEEAVENVKRLRNHPSIAMWCGNNEIAIYMGSNYWGNAKGAFRNRQDSMSVINAYKEVFHSILPAVVKGYDDEKFYWSSSPQPTNWSTTNRDSRTSGDVHYWEVWGGKKPIELYLENIGPFMSEYGFQSFPDMQTIKTFATPQDYDINSEIMKAHQRSYVGNGAILQYMQAWYKVPKSFPNFLYTGQVLQAEAIKLAIEAHRRAKPYCMGSLYWQIDDCWPAASWSSMDYNGFWKAQQYESKRAFEPLLVSPIVKKDSVQVYVVSDQLKPVAAQLQIRLLDFSGKVLNESKTSVNVSANTSTNVYRVSVKTLLKGANRNNVLLDVRLLSENQELAQNCLYFENPKNLKLNKPAINYTLTKDQDRYVLKLNSTQLAKNLRVSAGDDAIIFSDNYFDLIPGKEKSVTFQSSKALKKSDIVFMSINEAAL